MIVCVNLGLYLVRAAQRLYARPPAYKLADQTPLSALLPCHLRCLPPRPRTARQVDAR